MVWQFDHRYGTYEQIEARGRSGIELTRLKKAEYDDPNHTVLPWYWVLAEEVENRLSRRDRDGEVKWEWRRRWTLAFRDVTNAITERTAIFSVVPRVGLSDQFGLVFPGPEIKTCHVTCMLANFNSLVFDYIARQKIGGTHLKKYVLYQLPVLPLQRYDSLSVCFIVPRILELTFTAWDIKAFADDIWKDADESLRQGLRGQWEENRTATGGHELKPPEWTEIDRDGIPYTPFKRDENRRAVLRAELDAYYARLYGLNRDELCYILDPKDVYGPNFPGETFRVLKEKEEKEYGQYRTRHLVLQAWDKLNTE